MEKELIDNPHMKRPLMQIGLLKGEAGELQKRIRRREISDKKTKEWVEKGVWGTELNLILTCQELFFS